MLLSLSLSVSLSSLSLSLSFSSCERHLIACADGAVCSFCLRPHSRQQWIPFSLSLSADCVCVCLRVLLVSLPSSLCPLLPQRLPLLPLTIKQPKRALTCPDCYCLLLLLLLSSSFLINAACTLPDERRGGRCAPFFHFLVLPLFSCYRVSPEITCKGAGSCDCDCRRLDKWSDGRAMQSAGE